jgi:hypothetical protein
MFIATGNRKWQVDNNATDKPKVHDLAWKSRRHEIIESLIKPDYISKEST